MRLTGIKERSLLNSINSFHVTTNYAVCVMHDIFEGVCHYDMCHIINYFISSNFFSLDTLNGRKQMFNYGEIEIGNYSPQITKEHINNFKMTAREMMTFMYIFPMMVGDLVPEDDHIWLFLLNLLEIIDILLLNEISLGLAERLKILIKKHHRDYIRYFNDTLKPKHHFMLHYFDIILNSGPPRFFWAFRFEAKHKDFKTFARNITSRKNICVSLAKKFQFQFAYNLLQPEKQICIVDLKHKVINSTFKTLIERFCLRNELNLNVRSYSECFYLSKILHLYILL